MILHTLNASPASSAFRDCLRIITPGDALVLLGDGVYAAIPGTPACDLLQTAGVEVHALETDARAAGICELIEIARRIDMDDFVALTERFERQQAWY